jgi:hypothetical protein
MIRIPLYGLSFIVTIIDRAFLDRSIQHHKPVPLGPELIIEIPAGGTPSGIRQLA